LILADIENSGSDRMGRAVLSIAGFTNPYISPAIDFVLIISIHSSQSLGPLRMIATLWGVAEACIFMFDISAT
jgi:hypothetical protein